MPIPSHCCRALLAGLLMGCAACSGADGAAPLPLRNLADLPLPGDTSRFDYESYDSGRHLLFIAHLGASEVLAFDTQAQRVVGRIAGVRHVHGVLVVPELGLVYASATGTDEVVAIDEARLEVVARMPGGTYPDGMAYVPELHKLYVSDETGETETVIDTRSNQHVTTIELYGEAGNTQYDPVTRHIFVNVQSRRQLVEIDPASDRVVARDNLPGAEGNHGLLLEPRQHLAIIACEDNNKLLVFDLRTRVVTATFDVGKEPDVLAYDPGLNLLYVAGEAGVGSLFRLESGSLAKLADGFVGPNAHVVAVDPATHRAYFPIKKLDGGPVLRIVEPQR